MMNIKRNNLRNYWQPYFMRNCALALLMVAAFLFSLKMRFRLVKLIKVAFEEHIIYSVIVSYMQSRWQKDDEMGILPGTSKIS